MDHILALAEFGKNPQGGVSRVAYSDADKQGREYVLGLMRAAQLDVTVDAAGNLIGRRAGSAARLPPLLIGSHIDTVPEGGNYDGVQIWDASNPARPTLARSRQPDPARRAEGVVRGSGIRPPAGG